MNSFSLTEIVKNTLVRPALLSFILLDSCVQPFPLQSVGYERLLVVDGFISTDLKKHQVAISSTAPVGAQSIIPETGAQVTIKEDENIIQLTEESPGLYNTPIMQGVVGKTYQLFILTQAGRQIQSAEVVLRETPAISNLYATYSKNIGALNGQGGFQIYLDTEDPAAQSRFYRWEYDETWEITTPFESNFKWTGGDNVVFRDSAVSRCWGMDTTDNQAIASTKGLNLDQVTAKVIQTIPNDSYKLQVLYSILVRQYTLSEDGYNYWRLLLNTNQGTISNYQPGTVMGNLSSTADNETVLGYFDACAVQSQRFFLQPLIFRSSGYVPIDYGFDCKSLDMTVVPEYQIGLFYSHPENNNFEILGTSSGAFFLLPKQCCDCVSPTSPNIKPSFWPR